MLSSLADMCLRPASQDGKAADAVLQTMEDAGVPVGGGWLGEGGGGRQGQGRALQGKGLLGFMDHVQMAQVMTGGRGGWRWCLGGGGRGALAACCVSAVAACFFAS